LRAQFVLKSPASGALRALQGSHSRSNASHNC
jgi:hypothetical protein